MHNGRKVVPPSIIFSKAEEGDLDAQLTLLEAFDEGKNAARSAELVSYIEQKIFNSSDDLMVKLGVLWNIAVRAGHRGDYPTMKTQFNRVIIFMQENIPMEEWDFSLFEHMSDFLEHV